MAQSFPTAAARLKEYASVRKFTGRLKRLAWRCGAALTVWSAPATNPFLQRTLRTEARRHKPLLTVLGCLLTAFLVNITGWWLWDICLQRLPPSRAAYWPPGVLPPSLGSNFVGFIGILTTAVCACAILYVSRVRSVYLLRQELLKGTLDQLHLLPLSEERWLWMMSAHPLAISLLIGLLGAPVYFLELFTGQWTALDILGLFLVFVLLGFAVPSWQPLFWKAQGTRKRRQRFDLKKWRAASAHVKVDFDTEHLTPEQQLEMERRIQRALVDLMDEAVDNTTTATPSTTAPGKLNVQLGGVSAAIPIRAVRAGVGWLLANLFLQIIISGAFGRGVGPFGTVWHRVDALLPDEVMALLPAFPLTWPLLIARTLLAPLPFFAFFLPPVVLLAPLWIGLNHQKLLSVAANVSNAETFWTRRRARGRKAITMMLWIVTAWLVFGYGWKALMVDADIAALLPGTPRTSNWAMAAAWTLAIVIATVTAGKLLEIPLTRRVGSTRLDKTTTLDAWHAAARAITAGLGAAILIYFMFCWLGGLSGMSTAWVGRLLPTLATAGAFLLADFGSGALQSAVSDSLRVLCRIARWLWFFGLAAEAMIRVIVGSALSNPFSFDRAPHVLLSPFVTLFALFRQPAWQPQIQFSLLIQAAIGLVSLALAAILTLRSDTTIEAATGHSSIDLIVAPFMAIYRLWCAFWAAVRQLIEYVKRVLGQCEEAIIRRGARYDNPVLTAHLRWKVHKEHWPAQWIGALALGGALMLLCGGGPLLSFIIDKATRNSPGGTSFTAFLELWGTAVVYVVLVIGWLLAGIAGSDAGMAFDRDRANGSLVFLFLTPLTDKAIVGGKLVVGFFDVLFLLSTGLPWLLMGCLAGVIGGNLSLPLVCIAGMMAVLSTLALAVCVQTLFAVRAIKPGEGAAKALIAFMCIEAAYATLLAVPLSIAGQDLSGPLESKTGLLITLPLATTLVHLLLAYVCWTLALLSLRRIRYGDVAVGGKATG